MDTTVALFDQTSGALAEAPEPSVPAARSGAHRLIAIALAGLGGG
ncbi:hypothetical protein [Amnibacterium setariae]|nr:hypothetical protein [Amnibacterium setariae]